MPLYKCESCDFCTKILSHFNRHLNTKKHKKIIENNGLITNNYENTTNLTPKTTNLTPKTTNLTPNNTNLNNSKLSTTENNNRLICQHCKIEFSRLDSLNRHQKSRCKAKKEFEKKREEEKLHIIKLEEEKNLMSEQINELIKKVGNTINHNVNNNNSVNNNIDNSQSNTLNNTLNNTLDNSVNKNVNNSVNNKVNNTIKINNFGEENLSMLNDAFMKNMVQLPFTAIPKKIKRIHFNDKYPENKNIRLLNKKDNKLQVLKNNKWIYVKKKETIQQLIDDKNYILDDYYENNKEQFDDIFQKRFERFRNKVDEVDKNLLREMYEDIELILFNNK